MKKEMPPGAYRNASLATLPGWIAFFMASSWSWVLLYVGSIVCFAVAIMGYRRREDRSDLFAPVVLALYGALLFGLGYMAWAFVSGFHGE